MRFSPLVLLALASAVAASRVLTAVGHKDGRLHFGAVSSVASSAVEAENVNVHSAAAAAQANPPSGELLIRQALLDALAPNAVTLLTSLVPMIDIPDVTTTTNVAVLGDIDLTLSDIVLENLDVNRDRSFINLQDGFGTLAFADIGARLTARWRFRQRNWPHTKGDGDVKVSATQGNVAVNLNVNADLDGYVQLSVLDAATQFRSIDIKLSNSGWSWLLNIVTGLFKSSIRETISTQINDLLKTTLPEKASEFFRTQPLSVNIFNLANMDVGFVNPFSITPERIDASNHLLITSANGDLCPFKSSLATRTHVDTIDLLRKEVRGYIDQSVLQCAVWAVSEKVDLKATIRQSDLPDNIVFLTTDSWDELVPVLPELYPSRPMEIDAAVVGTPQISLSRAAGATATLQTLLNFFVIEKSGARTPVFVLNANIRASLENIKILQSDDYVSNQIAIALKGIEIETSVASSNVGEIDNDIIQETFEALGFLAVSVVNDQLLKPIDIPKLPYIRFVKPIIEYSENEIAFASDFALSTTE